MVQGVREIPKSSKAFELQFVGNEGRRYLLLLQLPFAGLYKGL